MNATVASRSFSMNTVQPVAYQGYVFIPTDISGMYKVHIFKIGRSVPEVETQLVASEGEAMQHARSWVDNKLRV